MSSYRPYDRFIADEDYPVVQTRAGKYLGYVDDDVFTFKGMEYAYADRFHMPEPPKAFEGVKDAYDYGYGCPEMTYNMKGKIPGNTLIQPGMYWNMDEHVQVLNVWTKSIEKDAKKPVFFYIHGGGYAGGAANHLFIYEGWALAHEHDVVVVSINHRLNMLGYLDLSEFGERYKYSGNLGQADIVAALQWVQANIANFGGDPDNVTICGQSGGGGKVSTLMQMPAADGLYHKAIIQSGVMGGGTGPRRAEGLGAEVVKVLGLPKEDISAIETMDYDQLAAAVNQACENLGIMAFGAWAPYADGEYFLGDPRSVGFRKETENIPLLIGSDLNEFGPVPQGRKSNWTDEQKMDVIRKRFGEEKAEAIAEAFKKSYPGLDYSYAAGMDVTVRPATLDFIRRRCQDAKAPVYSYVFAFENMVKGGTLSAHGAEMPFMFHNAYMVPGMRKEGITDRLQKEMAGAWTTFAATGSPNAADLPEWPAYTPETETSMVFGDRTGAAEHMDSELMELVKGLPAVDPMRRR